MNMGQIMNRMAKLTTDKTLLLRTLARSTTRTSLRLSISRPSSTELQPRRSRRRETLSSENRMLLKLTKG